MKKSRKNSAGSTPYCKPSPEPRKKTGHSRGQRIKGPNPL
jgi:hypothetical protein